MRGRRKAARDLVNPGSRGSAGWETHMNEDRTKPENLDPQLPPPADADLELPAAVSAGLRGVYGGEPEVPAHIDVGVILAFRAEQGRKGRGRYLRRLTGIAAGLALATGAIYFTAKPFMKQDQGTAIADNRVVKPGGGLGAPAGDVGTGRPTAPTVAMSGSPAGPVALADAAALDKLRRDKGLPTGPLSAKGGGREETLKVLGEAKDNRADIDKDGRADVLDALRLALTIRRVKARDTEGLVRLGYKKVDPPEAVLDLVAWDMDNNQLLDQEDVDAVCRQVVRLGGSS